LVAIGGAESLRKLNALARGQVEAEQRT